MPETERCPECGYTKFDGYNCRVCGFSPSARARTTRGRALSPEETKKLEKEFGLQGDEETGQGAGNA